MSLNYDQALSHLANLRATNSSNEATLRNLVNSLDINASGSVTVLYSGTVNGNQSTEIAKALALDSKVRILDKTAAASFLNIDTNRAFSQALEDVFGDRPSDRGSRANAFLFGQGSGASRVPNGAWDNISSRFVNATTGVVKILTEFPGEGSVFRKTELPALFQKLQTSTDITEISGINRQKWLAEFANDTDRLNAVVRSAASETLLTKPTPTNFSSFINLTESSYLSLQRSAQSDYFAAMQKVARDYPMTAVATRSFARLGTPLAVLGAVLVGFQAGDAHAAGRPDEARTIVEDYAVEMAASTAGQAAGFTVATLGVAALAAAGVAISAPVAVGIVLVASVAGGYFGGEYGKDIAYLFQDRSEAQKRDIANRMLKLMYGDSYSLGMQVPQRVLDKTLTIDATFSRDQMVEAAKQDIAWRYALRELNPFVISNISYDLHNTDGSLNLYNKETSPEGLTNEYLADRAAMLAWKLRYDKEKKPYGSDYNTDTIQGNWDFVDVASGVTLQIDGKGISLSDHQIVFGNKEANTIDGSGDTDRLYGMAGNDTLDGKAGNDYIEGGIGDDKLTGGTGDDTLIGGTGKDNYIFTGLFGNDTITDSDGQGNITIAGAQLGSLTQVQDNVWENASKTLIFTQITAAAASAATGGQPVTNLIIGQRSAAGAGSINATITVTGFKDGDLGINLGQQTKKIETNGFVVADRKSKGDQGSFFEDSQYWIRSQDTPSGPITIDAGAGNDLIGGNTQAETITGGAGHDWIAGGGGKDVLLGGAGYDWIIADINAKPNGGLDQNGQLVEPPTGWNNTGIYNDTGSGKFQGYGWAMYTKLDTTGIANEGGTLNGPTDGTVQSGDTSDVFIDGGAKQSHSLPSNLEIDSKLSRIYAGQRSISVIKQHRNTCKTKRNKLKTSIFRAKLACSRHETSIVCYGNGSCSQLSIIFPSTTAGTHLRVGVQHA
jgi:hypothetical protein